MSTTREEKVKVFRALHAGPGAFVMPNPWDAGSARLLAGMGFPALATSSSASAGTLGRRDYQVTRDEALAMAGAIAQAVDVPVSADLENGFGDAPEIVAETIRRAAATGLAGGSIEDSTGNEARPVFEIGLATERIAAAVAAARAVPGGFVLTARTECFVNDIRDLDEVIRRLQAFERAGADVLFAPGLPSCEAARAVCAAVGRPVNFMNGLKGASFSVAELAAAGVKRISVAASFYRAAMTGLREAAREVREQGTFGYTEGLMTSGELGKYFS